MTKPPDPDSILAGGGEMGKLMRSIDWRRTAVGPVDLWPQSLRTALSILLETGFPMYIAWGSDFTQFYNDGYRPILGSTKHPAAMGRSTTETFAEIWDVIGPMFHGVMDGRPTTLVDFLLLLDRHGFAEECYFVFSYSPIRQESGTVGGVLVTVTETTQRVLGERRLSTTQALATETREARTMAEACAIAARVLGTNTADLPFALVYRTNPDRTTATLASRSGQLDPDAAFPDTIRLDREPFSAALRPGGVFLPADAATAATPVETGSATPASGRVVALPITYHGLDHPVGVLVAGTSSRLMLDDAYREFLSLVAAQIGTALTAASALEEAKARAEALAALDRAKTTFFSNVSHEFRTPLTLMLGPTEEALKSPERRLDGDDLEAVHRNGVRLLKLVNTLLDFSRIEAGRVTATFTPTDLAALTANVASAFRSATERAGLELIVDCPPLPTPVHVDAEMWEKIILNLMSNAFKFTFHGAIRVELVTRDGTVELRVHDTGEGIAPDDLPRVFDRFYRIERSAGRTHEGSGIGLALVRELVALHGGTIEASSVLGLGTTFTVRLPLGTAHLPPEQIVTGPRRPAHAGAESSGPDRPSGVFTAQSYVEEALRWLPGEPSDGPVPTTDAAGTPPHAAMPRILVADDNADMREYLLRLLTTRFLVEAVGDGAAALASALRERPDLILSDVMMPVMDGFELLKALRSEDHTRSIPFIMLSARAGEEARIDGLEAGANDYLVKPFAARELLARIEAQLVQAKMQSLEEANAARLANVFAMAPVGVAILRGADHVYEYANEFYVDLVRRHEVIGKPIREALPELEGQGIYELLDQVFRSGEPFVGRSVPVMLMDRQGRPTDGFYDFVYQPLLDTDEHVTGIAVVAFDVTALTNARRDAETANRAKDEFLAMLGHELRNPLAPIVTALHLMRLRNVTGADRELTIIDRQIKHLVLLVDDLLDVSRITSGEVQLDRQSVDMADIAARAVEVVLPSLQKREQVLDVQMPTGLMVSGDAARLTQVLVNLLSNAVKYTDTGGNITISGRADNSTVDVVVADTGRGISADVLPRVFDKFWQERQELDRSDGGLGLGLAIVKSLVQKHGGTVDAQSDGKGQGSRFAIRLPRVAGPGPDGPARAPAPGAAASDSATLRVLIVDDNADAVELLADAVRSMGHVIHAADDGPSAVEAVAAFRPDVVLLDLGLPLMDGFEVARQIRALPESDEIGLVAVTGYGREVDRHLTREAGFDLHLVKPVDLAALSGWLSNVSRRADSA